jgi:hypothetical protein
MNKKGQVTQERLYSVEIKRGQAAVIMKELVGQKKNVEKQSKLRNAINSSKSHPWLFRRGGKMKRQSQGKPDDPGNKLAILAVG